MGFGYVVFNNLLREAIMPEGKGYKPHPEYTVRPLPKNTGKVQDTGRYDNPNAGTRGMDVQPRMAREKKEQPKITK